MSKLEKKKTAKSKKAAKRRRSLIIKFIILLIMVAVLIVGIVFLVKELSNGYPLQRLPWTRQYRPGGWKHQFLSLFFIPFVLIARINQSAIVYPPFNRGADYSNPPRTTVPFAAPPAINPQSPI